MSPGFARSTLLDGADDGAPAGVPANQLDSIPIQSIIIAGAMNTTLLRPALLCAWLTAGLLAAEDAVDRPHMKDVLKARLLEESKRKSAGPSPATAPAANSSNGETTATRADPATPPLLNKTPPEPVAPEPKGAEAPKGGTPASEPATILPKVEVTKSRITELDRQLHLQEKEIAREKKNTQPTELDKALNDTKVAKALSIFGGESNQYRAQVAKERVSLMEEEKDLLEAIARARTKEEKAELEKQLVEIKAMRRQLEKSLK